MARKSRKHQYTEGLKSSAPVAVGYIRLSVANKEECNSIENQKFIIECWGKQHQISISHYYIDNGFSGKRFVRPAFQEMIEDILAGKINCVIVKDLSRLGRDYITTGYYIEVIFPANGVRFVSVNDQFDTIDGITNSIHPCSSKVRIPITNAFNEQVSIEIKKKLEAILDMKAQHGTFIGPRAPFGYQKSESIQAQLIPDSKSSIIVRKIFELAANGVGVTAIVRYLNEKEIPTPIRYARSNGLSGSYDDGNGNWNSRSVKYILTNRTYTGMLVQGKEKRAVPATHEALVDTDTFDAIQKAFQTKTFNLTASSQSMENILKGKVICGCCGGKMQRKRGTNHVDWHFFICITKNRLGTNKCTGMYVREEDVLSAVYYQLKQYVDQHFITKGQYKQEIQRLDSIIEAAFLKYEEAADFIMKQYENYVMGEGSKETIAVARPVRVQVEAELNTAIADKAVYEKQYRVYCKLLKVSRKEVPLSEIVVDADRRIVVK
ncbi:MAG: recombinase family protein [Anaerorhabdus sp.]|uniref:recombinase family protein n=1 Tax=Anaerorhabdus sp. TaxID=1872524 RepID=UPI002FC714A4